MKLTIIVIGDEILLGQVTDTNSGEISRTLGPEGWETVETMVIGDNADAIRLAIEKAMGQSDLVITTGGLGPTKDDITKTVMTAYFGGELREDPEVVDNIHRVFEKRNLKMNALTRAQAMVPTSCKVIQNVLGTAPIMWFERDGKVLVAMPGVPFETVGMLHSAVLPEILRHFRSDIKVLHHTMMVSGITESALAEHLCAWEENLPPHLHLAYLPTPGLIRLRLDGHYHCADTNAEAQFADAVSTLANILGTYLIYDGDATAAMIVLHYLRKKGWTLATAESCTGGNIARSITKIPGCSDTYVGSVVSYSNDVKQRLLGVNPDTLADEGAVSENVVRRMANGVCMATGADCAVATSGIAGPGGGSDEKPVGTVWIAATAQGQTVARCMHLPGDRQRVINRATTEALLLLLSILQ